MVAATLAALTGVGSGSAVFRGAVRNGADGGARRRLPGEAGEAGHIAGATGGLRGGPVQSGREGEAA